MNKVLGFTLIELLVVIVILAILTAILFPVFAMVREKARIASCANNVKQLGLAVKLYADDYNEAYPYGGFDTRQQGYFTEFSDIIMPYVKSFKVFFCPSGTQRYNPKLTNAENSNLAKNGNYSTNRKLMPYQDSINYTPPPVYLYSVKAESSVYAVYEGSYSSMSSQDLTLCGGHRAFLPGSGATNGKPFVFEEGDTEADVIDYMKGRHNKGLNIAFADGHVKYISSKDGWDQIFINPSPWNPADWN